MPDPFGAAFPEQPNFGDLLAQAQTQGLPFQGSMGQPRPPLAPVTLQGGQPPQSTAPVSTGQGIGRMLEGFGAGVRGQVAPWEQIQLAEQQRALQQQALAQQQAQMDQAMKMQNAQLPHIQAQTQLLQGQVAEMGFKTLQHASMFLPFIPEGKQQEFLDSVRPVIQQQFQMGAANDPAAQQIAGNGSFIDYMIKSGTEKANAFVSMWPDLPPAAKSAVAQVAMSGDPEAAAKAEKLAATFEKQQRQTMTDNLGQRFMQIQQIPGQAGKQVTLPQALDLVQASPAERRAVARWVEEKPAGIEGVFQSLGIVSPFTAVEEGKAAATARGAESTAGGQAKIAETRAGTTLKGEEAKKAGVVTIPGQGGGVATLPGTQAAALTAGGGGAAGGDALRQQAAATSDPMQKAAFLAAAAAADKVAALAPPMGGIQLAPGMTMLGQSPGAPMAPAAATDVANMEKTVAALQRMSGYAKDRSLDAYIGPVTTRLGGALTERIQTQTPFGGSLPPKVVDLQQANAELRNATIRNITGAAVRETEEPRILSEVPDIKTDKPAVFWQKTQQTLQTNQILLERKKAMYGPDGRMKADVDPAEIAAKYPLPKELGADVTGPQGKVTVKPGSIHSTGRP